MADLKNLIFFDFEMLCSTDGMPFAEMEAIRLGAVKYELESKTISYFDAFIKPTKDQPLSKFCKDLTGIIDLDLVNADDFKTVFANFLVWVGGVKRARFFSWSKSDMSRLKFDADKHHVAKTTIYKIEKRYVDFQQVFSKRVSKTNVSVEDGLKLYGLSFFGKTHNPMYDAYNTLRIYLSFLTQPYQSDIIMVNRFIANHDTNMNPANINSHVKDMLLDDIKQFTSQCYDIYHIRHVKKIIKKAKQLMNKYDNVMINRSGIFSSDVISYIKHFKQFYDELLTTYHYHYKHASKTVILDEYLVYPLKKIAS